MKKFQEYVAEAIGNKKESHPLDKMNIGSHILVFNGNVGNKHNDPDKDVDTISQGLNKIVAIKTAVEKYHAEKKPMHFEHTPYHTVIAKKIKHDGKTLYSHHQDRLNDYNVGPWSHTISGSKKNLEDFHETLKSHGITGGEIKENPKNF